MVKLPPLGAALGIPLLVATVGASAAVARHHSPKPAATAVATPLPSNSATAAPFATSTPVPTPTPQPPPAGIKLYWRTVVHGTSDIEAVDSFGIVRGRLTLPMPADIGDVTSSPDGQRLLLKDPEHYTVMSAQGRTLGVVPADVVRDGLTWADDNQHFCSQENNPDDTQTQVFLVGIGGQPRRITTMSWPQGDGGAQLLACSMHSDLAVLRVALGDDEYGHVVEYKVVRISSGQVVRDVFPPQFDTSSKTPRAVPGMIGMVSASGDGRRLALTPWAPMGAPLPTSTIVDAVTGSVLGRMRSYDITFSDDDAAFDLTTMRTAWQTQTVTAMPRRCCAPKTAGDEDLIISIQTGPPPTQSPTGGTEVPPPDTFALLHPDGTVVRLAWGGANLL